MGYDISISVGDYHGASVSRFDDSTSPDFNKYWDFALHHLVRRRC
jgi:hypothetical protein